MSAGQILGASWGTDDSILVGRVFGVLYRVPSSGGDAEPVTTLGPDERSHTGPSHLPGGRAAVFTVTDVAGARHVGVVSLETGQHRLIVAEGTSPVYLPTGHLVFQRDGGLQVAPFDADRLELTDVPVVLMEGIHVGFGVLGGDYAVGGPSGTLVYVRQSSVRTELRWVDRGGATIDVVGLLDGLIRTFELSPDERVLAFRSGLREGLRLYYMERRVTTDLLDSGADPNWSADGGRLAYADGYAGRILSLPVNGGSPTLLYERGDGIAWLDDWSQTGDRLLVHLPGNPVRGAVVFVDGRSEPLDVFAEGISLDQSEFSPDGNWIAFNADHFGRGHEVCVVPSPPSGERFQVSSGGGMQPQWRADGRELFYLTPGGALMGVPVETVGRFRPGTPVHLFDTGFPAEFQIEQYGVARDGKRFLVPTPVGAASEGGLVLVQNWFEEVRARVPAP
jgi:hypothetical protein